MILVQRASGLDDEAWGAFRSVVDSHLIRRGIAFEWTADGEIELVHDALPDGRLTASPLNVARACRDVHRGDWPAVVEAHFESILAMGHESADLARRLTSLDSARELLRSQVLPHVALESGALVARPLTGELDLVLVADMPTQVLSVNADQVASWGVSHAELLELGLANVKRELRDVAPQALGLPEAPVHAFASESFFTASLAATLSRAEEGRHGLLVGMPTRHVLLVHEIASAAGAIQALGWLADVARRMHDSEPGPLSPYPHVLHEGRFTELRVSVQGRDVSLPDPASAAVLGERLRAAG